MAPPVVVGNTGTAPRSAVVWLHGLGDTAHGWAALMQQLALPMPHTRFELPTAPERPVSCNGGMQMTSWMDLAEIPVRVSSPDTGRHLQDSIEIVHKQLDLLVKDYGLEPRNIVLGGFSQGGALAVVA